jgi:hypothetical protein
MAAALWQQLYGSGFYGALSGRHTSILIPKSARRFANFESKDISKFIDLVWLCLRSPHNKLAAIMMRTSKPSR